MRRKGPPECSRKRVHAHTRPGGRPLCVADVQPAAERCVPCGASGVRDARESSHTRPYLLLLATHSQNIISLEKTPASCHRFFFEQQQQQRGNFELERGSAEFGCDAAGEGSGEGEGAKEAGRPRCSFPCPERGLFARADPCPCGSEGAKDGSGFGERGSDGDNQAGAERGGAEREEKGAQETQGCEEVCEEARQHRDDADSEETSGLRPEARSMQNKNIQRQ
mmetsp:Transcript_16475/g.29582  ORF Transcript_16475/g.29582 Transcript_16475/m.29582 type:complete len:223 (-) Transcript_16475:249-917(-)